MSTELAERQSALVTKATELASQVAVDPRVTRALSVAETTKGIVVTNDTEAALANDHLAALLEGERTLARGVKAVTDIAYTVDEPADYWNERGYSRYDGL